MNKIRKKRFSSYSLPEALKLISINQLHHWQLENIVPRQPSEVYQQNMARLKLHFDLSLSEAAKCLVIDAILLEAIAEFSELKIWKEVTLQTENLTGVVDYLIAPQGKVYQLPLLCVVEAKKDNFEQGLAQCLVEMYACQQLNQAHQAIEIYGIISNAVSWRFYKLTTEKQVYESAVYAETQLDSILGILYALFSQCTINLNAVK